MGEWRTLRKVVRLAGNAVGGWLFSSAPQQMSELRPIEDNWLTSFTSRDIISWLYLGVLFWFNERSVIQVELVLLCFDLLCFAGDALFFFPQVESLCFSKVETPCIERACWYNFPNSICSLSVPVSHFGNSRTISSFFVILYVVLIWDQWSLMSLLGFTESSMVLSEMVVSIFQ